MQQVGPYRLVRSVGRGGAGEVHEALTPDGRRVALKLLTAFDPGGLLRFARERALLAQLSTEGGFVPLLDMGDSPEGPWLVMPLLEGGTLRDRLRTGPLPVDEALRLGALLARTVGRAHARGIVHRDLKPENVLFDARGAAFVADLGLAKGDAGAAPPTPTPSLTGEMRGTAGYMAPEQMNDAKRVGPAADVFSLGVVLFESLVGHGPFDVGGASAYEVMSRVARGAYEPLTRERPEAPRWVDAVVARCLAADPAERWADAGELADALEAGPDGAPAGRGQLLLVAAAVLLALVAVAAVVGTARLWPRGAEAPTESAPPPPPTTRRELPPTPTPAPLTGAPPARASMSFGRAIGGLGLKCSGELRALHVAERAPTVFAGDESGVVRAFDLDRGGKPVLVYDSGQGAIVDIACSPDGGAVATVHRNGAVQVKVGQDRPTRLTDDRGKPLVVAWSGAGRHVLVGTDDGTITRWDLAARRQDFTIRGTSGVNLLAPSPAGRLLCAGRLDGVIEVWDLEARKQLRQTKVKGSGGQVSAAAWGPDDGELALGLTKGQVMRLTAADLSLVGVSQNLGARVVALAFEAGGGLAVVTTGERVRLDAAGTVVARTALEPGGVGLRRPVVLGAIEGTARRAVVAYEKDMTLRCVDLGSGSATPIDPGHDGWVFALARDPATGHLLSGSLDRTVRLWSLDDDIELARADLTDRVGDVCLGPEGQGHAALFDTGGVLTLRLPGLSSRARNVLMIGIVSVAWTAQGGLLVGARDGVVHVMEPQSLAELTSWRAHPETVEALSVLPDGRILTRGAEVKAGADMRTTLALWDGPSIEVGKRLVVPPARPRAQAVAPDGAAVYVAAATTGTVVAVDLPSLRERWKVELEGGRFVCAALDASGQLLLVGGLDRRLRVLDVKDGRLLGDHLFDDFLETPTALLTLPGGELVVGTSLGRLLRAKLER